MKKKELKAEIRRQRDLVELYRGLIMDYAKILLRKGVETRVDFPEPEMLEATEPYDDEPQFIRGKMNSAPPEITVDFTKHDNKIRETVLHDIRLAADLEINKFEGRRDNVIKSEN